MENEELENIDSQNDEQENIDSSNDNEEVEESEDESTEQPEYTDNEKQLYARMKKAEKEAKELREAQTSKKKEAPKKKADDTGLSTTDIIALSKADIDDEDIDEVLDYAKYKGISVKEALQSSILKSTISEAAEQRKSAQAVNTGSTRRASGNVSDERLLADAKKGVMPEKDEDIARLTMLRFQNK